MRRVVLAYPGHLETRTGGYGYDRRAFAALAERGWHVEHLALPAGRAVFDRGVEAAIDAALGALTAGRTVVIDGLAYGAMPTPATRHGGRLDLVALVHHPLCLETGLAAAERAALRRSEIAALAHARHVIATSPATAATLMRAFEVAAHRLTAAVPGTDPAPLAAGSGGGPFRLAYVASLIPRKGHIVLLRALARLLDLDWRLTCVGGRPDEAHARLIEAEIDRLGLAGRIELVGELEQASVAEVLHGADGAVSASLYEGYGMALAEALACGLPVVAAAGGAVAQTVPAAAGLLVPPGDEAALALALRRLMVEPDLRERLRAGARAARARLPTWADTAAAIETALLHVR